jgi:hypothetical protein
LGQRDSSRMQRRLSLRMLLDLPRVSPFMPRAEVLRLGVLRVLQRPEAPAAG